MIMHDWNDYIDDETREKNKMLYFRGGSKLIGKTINMKSNHKHF